MIEVVPSSVSNMICCEMFCAKSFQSDWLGAGLRFEEETAYLLSNQLRVAVARSLTGIV